MTKMTQKEAKRLRKSVKRRRVYADNLRNSVAEIRAAAQASGVEEDVRFADRLDALADSELATARAEETQAKEIEAQRPPFSNALFGGFSSQESRERSERAMASMAGSFAVDRVRHLLGHHKITPSGDNHLDMREVEKRLGLTERVEPKGGPRMQMGARIALAETTAFGAPRF